MQTAPTMAVGGDGGGTQHCDLLVEPAEPFSFQMCSEVCDDHSALIKDPSHLSLKTQRPRL